MPRPKTTQRAVENMELIQQKVNAMMAAAADIQAMIGTAHLGDVPQLLSDAAVRNGMQRDVSFGYSDPLMMAIKRINDISKDVMEQADTAKSEVGTAVHILTVVPHRVPNPQTSLDLD